MPDTAALRRTAELQRLYRHSPDAVRARFGGREEAARRYYAPYVGFVSQLTPHAHRGRLLDIGCGAGWSTSLLARMGFDAVGIDTNATAFEAPSARRVHLCEASALDLPFADAAFDVVSAFQTLEHVPDPARALAEMVRVCKPGGLIGVLSPNLLSFGMSVRAITVYAWRNRPVRRIFWRTADMPRHPFGNTLPECLRALVSHAWLATQKCLASEVSFTMRVPDLLPPFHADNDACYLCNPVDLVRFFRAHGCRVLRQRASGRPPGTALIAGGTFVAVRKLSIS
jgi:SAM-dependent methyltransferase